MATSEAPKSKGSKLNRSETVTVRLDPKLRYLAELAARKQRRTLSSYIEWAIEESLKLVEIEERPHVHFTVADQASLLYDVDEPDRLVKLAFNYPHLLAHEEQLLWKLIRENGYLWEGYYNERNKWVWDINEENFKFPKLRKNWDIFKKVAKDELPRDALPTWQPPKKTPENTRGKPDMDDDIPF